MKVETIAKAINAACESIGCAPKWTEDEIGTLVSEVRCGNHHSPASVHAVLHTSAAEYGPRENAVVSLALAICSALAKLPDLPEAQTEEVQAEAPAQQEPIQEQQPQEEAGNGAEEKPAE